MNVENFFVFLPNSKRAFQCDSTDGDPLRRQLCGANVFHKDAQGRFVCNGCGARYIGEASQQSACGKWVTSNDDGAFRVHGPRNNRCSVNAKPPPTVSEWQRINGRIRRVRVLPIGGDQ